MAGFLIVDSSRCTHDTVDGETLIIDNITGQLILLNGFADSVWAALSGGVDVSVLLREVTRRYGETAAYEVDRLITELHETGIVTTTEPSLAANSLSDTTRDWPDDYTAVGLERINDIADIMAMDPIHDVDTASGWPFSPEGQPRSDGA